MNKLAFFLDANLVSDGTLHRDIRKWNSPTFKPLDGRFRSGHELKFDSDWNWTMAVVTKINSIYETMDIEKLSQAKSIDLRQSLTVAVATTNINRTVVACLNFVEWYNNSK